jgi:hypothetical protein
MSTTTTTSSGAGLSRGLLPPDRSRILVQEWDTEHDAFEAEMPNNQTIYTPGQTTYLNVISIHD